LGAEPVLEARSLSKRFGSLQALGDVSFGVGRGESLTVFGPNGAGKTTLIRILTSSLRANSGDVRIAGRDPRKHETETRALIGVISHQTFLYDDLGALENLLFFARLYAVARPRERAETLLDSVGLLDRAEDPVRTFSRGMQQRLALARCLIHDPLLVFLDEPFTGLDPYAATLLRETLERLRREGRTLLMVTHNLAEGLELSDRWMILARGRVVGEGRSAGVDRHEFERTYFQRVGGSPAAPRPVA
jgi:heme exporter protein A